MPAGFAQPALVRVTIETGVVLVVLVNVLPLALLLAVLPVLLSVAAGLLVPVPRVVVLVGVPARSAGSQPSPSGWRTGRGVSCVKSCVMRRIVVCTASR